MKLPEMKEMLATGRYQAIVKVVAGRRMFLGIERKSRRSNRRHEKFMCSPVDLDQLMAKKTPLGPISEQPQTSPKPSVEDGLSPTPSAISDQPATPPDHV